MHLLTHLINKSWISTQVGSADKHSCLNRYRCWNMSVIKCVGTKKKLWKRKENNSSYHRPLPSKGWSGCGVSNLKTVGQRGQPLEVFYCTQYEPTVVRSYYRFFFMGKMVIWFILSKIFHIFHFLYRTIPFYIFDNTLIIPIRSLNTTVWQLKNSHIESISTVRSLHISPFLLHTSHFQPAVHVVLCTVKPQGFFTTFGTEGIKHDYHLQSRNKSIWWRGCHLSNFFYFNQQYLSYTPFISKHLSLLSFYYNINA
jgi:hypothetical protein